MSAPGSPQDDAAARAERKAARRVKRAAREQAEAGKVTVAPEEVEAVAVEISEPVKKPKKHQKNEVKQETVAEVAVNEDNDDQVETTSPSKPKRKRKTKSDDVVETEPITRNAADDEFIRQVRTSLDINRDYFPHDARKSLEMPPSVGDYRPSIELRRSFETPRRPGEERPAAKSSLEISRSSRGASVEKDMDKEEDADNILKTFPKSEGLSSEQAADLLEQYGRNELPEKVKPKWLIFCSLLWQPMPVMIWIAAIIEAAIGSYIDVIVLVIINIGNACLGYYETTKAGDAVAALKASLKPTAICFRDGVWDNQFDARLLVPGDLVELSSGAAVPADCMINNGQVEVDESAMTGESLPVTLHERELAKMGGTIARGETHATVVFTGKSTFFGKTAAMLGGNDGFSNLQKLLLRVMIILCVLSLVLCLAAFIYLIVKYGRAKEKVKEAVSFAVIVIVASIPMAIEIVTTSTLAIGSRTMSKFGAIVSRLAAIEDLAGLNMLCSDKTGTLTKNKMTIQDEAPTYVKKTKQMDLLKQAALAAKWESAPKDALDTLFLRCHLWCPGIKEMLEEKVRENPDWKQAEKDDFYNEQVNAKLQEHLADFESLAFVPFDPRVKRTESTIREKSTGRIFKVTKGAPHVLQQLDKDEKKNEKIHSKVEELGGDGVRAVAIAISDDLNDVWKLDVEEQDPNMAVTWHITGLLTFLDPPRDDTKDTIARSQAYGVPVRMITGDHLLIARKTCRDLDMGVKSHPNWPNIEGPDQLPTLDEDGKAPSDLVEQYGEYIKNADGFAQVFPEHKFLIVETYRRLGYKCGMTGDGVNDAPALKRADVGIAVAGATDAARAAADIILTQEGLSTIVLGLEISRVIFARMKSFLTYRMAATLQLLFFFFIAVFAFSPEAYMEDRKGILAALPPINDTAPNSTPSVPIGVPAPIYSSIPDSGSWPEFFSLPVIYLIIITVINDGTLISIGYDHAVPSPFPERWVLPVLFMISSTLASIACLSSLLWLHWSLDSWRPGSFFQQLGIGGIDPYGHIVNMMFLKVAVSDILTLFSSRTSHQFFFMRKPHFVLAICAVLALGITTTLALTWPCGKLDRVPVCGLAYQDNKLLALWVWIYCIIVFLIQDTLKVFVWWLIRHFNLFNINNEVDNELLGETQAELSDIDRTKKASPQQAETVAAEEPKPRKTTKKKADTPTEDKKETTTTRATNGTSHRKKKVPEPEPESESESSEEDTDDSDAEQAESDSDE
jgi:H+-transporting ATPase